MSRRQVVLPLDRQCELVGLPKPTPELKFHPTRRWRFDFAWEDVRLACEINGAVFTGGRHVRGSGVEKDMEKVAEAMILGWRVLQVSTGQVKSGQALIWLERLLREGMEHRGRDAHV